MIKYGEAGLILIKRNEGLKNCSDNDWDIDKKFNKLCNSIPIV